MWLSDRLVDLLTHTLQSCAYATFNCIQDAHTLDFENDSIQNNCLFNFTIITEGRKQVSACSEQQVPKRFTLVGPDHVTTHTHTHTQSVITAITGAHMMFKQCTYGGS